MIKLESCLRKHFAFWHEHTQLTVTHTNPQSAYPNVTSPMESRLGVCAPLFVQLKAKSLQTKGYRSQRLSYDRFLVLVDLVDLV